MTIIDQKVREKLAKVLREILPDKHMVHIYHEHVADAILQSPDLRVTLNEPKYHWIGKCVYLSTGEHTAKLVATCFDSELAKEYADWLNSKEPKS